MTRQLGSYYTVTPGQGEPEFFDRANGLKGLGLAMGRAAHLSMAGIAQQVTVTANGTAKVIFEYREGRETLRSCTGFVPAGKTIPAPPVTAETVITDLAARRRSRPRRRPAKATWPGLDLADPPCNRTG
jgi:hypothetical protein